MVAGVGASAVTIASSASRSVGTGVEHIRADFGEGRQAPDGVVEIGPPLKEVVGAASDDDASLRRVDGTTRPIDGLMEVADGLIGVARGVLNPDAGQAELDSSFDGRRNVFGGVAVAVLEVSVAGKPGEPAEQLRMFESSSRVSSWHPSARPSVAASAADDVLIAAKPASTTKDRPRRSAWPGHLAGMQRHEFLIEP